MRAAPFVVALALFGGCGAPGTFNCQDDAQCSNDGQCEADGFCSFPDDACPSMRRYGEHAPAGLAGQCVLPSGTGTGPDPSSTSGPDPSTTNPNVDTTSAVSATDDTSGVVDSSSSGRGPSDESSTGVEGEVLRNYVFITSADYAPEDIGGLDGADAICQQVAADAGLAGTYVAWLSSNDGDVIDRIPASAQGWARVDGRPFARSLADIVIGETYYPIRVSQFGIDEGNRNPNTGTIADGTFGGPGDCGGWTVSIGFTTRGHADALGDSWTNGFTALCTAQGLFCFGIDDAVEIPFEAPSTGRIAFATEVGIEGTAGVDAFDALCASEAASAGLVGDFKALVATTTSSAAERLALDLEGWVTPIGTVVVEDAVDLLSNGSLVTPVHRGADGSPVLFRAVWAGSTQPSNVAAIDDNCNDFTALGDAYSGRLDRSTVWWADQTSPCDGFRRVLCFED